MATHSSILAWWIPWTERSLVGYSPRGCKSRVWLSDFTFTKLKTAVCCWTPVFSRHWARHFYLLSLILLTNPSNPWYFSLNSDVFFTFIVVILFLYVYLMFIVFFTKLWALSGQIPWLFCSNLYTQFLAQCVTHTNFLVDICWIHKQMSETVSQ